MNRWRGTRLPLLPRDFCKPGSSNGRRPLSLTAAASLPLARDCELTYLIDMAEIQPLDRLGPTVDAPPLGPGPQPVHVSSPLEALEAKGTPAAAAPQHFRELTDSSITAFEHDWRLHATKGRDGNAVEPPLRSSFDQRQNTLTLSFSDKSMNEHSVTIGVEGQQSVGRFTASEIAPGAYRLGDPAFGEHGAWLGHGSHDVADIPEGWASVPIRNADGANVIAAHSGASSIVNGADVMVHGGGSGLAKPFAPDQPLERTYACIRGHNKDVLAIAQLVQGSGGSIPLEVESGVQSLQRSMDDGKTWAAIPSGLGMKGTVTKIEDGIVHQHAGRSEFLYKASDLEAAGFAAADMRGQQMYIGADRQGQASVMTGQEYDAGRSHGQTYQLEHAR